MILYLRKSFVIGHYITNGSQFQIIYCFCFLQRYCGVLSQFDVFSKEESYKLEDNSITIYESYFKCSQINIYQMEHEYEIWPFKNGTVVISYTNMEM